MPGLLPQVKAQSTCDLLRARWCEPVLSVVDIRVGDDEEAATDPFYRFGPTRFSVIPRSAVGNVSVRFVPDQVRCMPSELSSAIVLCASDGSIVSGRARGREGECCDAVLLRAGC